MMWLVEELFEHFIPNIHFGERKKQENGVILFVNSSYSGDLIREIYFHSPLKEIRGWNNSLFPLFCYSGK